jgi:LuxR family transcriptional regulator, maltose regulon positive regulatory protein
MDDQERHPAVMRTVIAALRLADDDPQAATVARSRPSSPTPSRQVIPSGMVEGLLLEAIARDMLGDAGAAQCPIERALDLAEPDRMLFPSTRRLDCLSAMPGSAPRTPP